MPRRFCHLPALSESLAVGCLFLNAHGDSLRAIPLTFLFTWYSLFLVTFLLISSLLFGLHLLSQRDLLKLSISELPQDAEKSLSFQPLLFPCQTSHSRLFPKKHSFKYSYLLIGLPIKLSTSRGRPLVHNQEQKLDEANPWFDIDAKFYLDRNNKATCLLDKLNDYLKSQDEELSKYAFVYLVTAPKFLGYAFNPVSFWYLYDFKRRLAAMILEVNNTFDERRMYLLKGADADDDANAATSAHPFVYTFADSWQKDFHVSPFNSRKGSYSLKSVDPFLPSPKTNPQIFNVITLSSSKEHPKLVASISSTGPSVNPTRLDAFGKFRFLLTWWWVGFVTYPRIVREAAKLFFRRKLHVWYRPEVTATSIGRQTSKYERSVELLFREWMRSLVEQSTLPYVFRYCPTAIGEQITIEFRSAVKVCETAMECDVVEFRPMTPAFYSNLVAASKTRQHLGSAIACKDPLKQTIYTSDPGKASELFTNSKHSWNDQPKIHAFPLEILMLRLHSLLLWTVRGFAQSELDGFVVSCAEGALALQYRQAAIKLIVARHLTLGFVEVIDLAIWAAKVLFWWEAIKYCGVALVSFSG